MLYVFENSGANVLMKSDGVLIGKIPKPIFEVLKLYTNSKFDKDQITEVLKGVFGDKSAIIDAEIRKKYANFLRLNLKNITGHQTAITDNDVLNANRIKFFEPNGFVLYLNNHCSCNCAYCYAGAGIKTKTNQKDMPYELFEKVLFEIKGFGVDKIDFTGGDILLHPQITKIMKKCVDEKIKYCFSTKTLLTPELISLIDGCKDYIQYVQISLDSLSEEEQNKLVSTPNYSKYAIENIKSLQKMGIPVKVNSVVTSKNFSSIIKLSDKLKEIGISKHVYSPYANNLCNSDPKLFPSEADYSRLRKEISSRSDLVNSFLELPVFLVDEENKEYTSCQAGLEGLVIDFKGDVFVCERLAVDTKYSIGNVYKQTIREIWNSNRIEEFSAPSRSYFVDGDCYECGHFDYCINTRGICYVHSIIINGNMYSKDNNCMKYKNKERIF